MGLLSFMKRIPGGASGAASTADNDDSAQQARTRARQRLVGASVLVVAGVIGFSMLFGGAPRPMASDIPIEIARGQDASTPPAAPAARRTPAAADEAPTLPPGVTTEQPAADASPTPVVVTEAPRPAASKPAEPRPAERRPAEQRAPEPTPTAAKPSESARAQALLGGREAAGRFVVQVGAFADNAAAGEARRKVERLGLKTYTQEVKTSAGSRVRVRVGPFASRGDADRAAGKIKSAGLPSAVLTL